MGFSVTVGNDLESALSRFKKKVKDFGLMLELKEREAYKKPSAKKREKRNKSKIRNKKTQVENE